MSYFPHHYRYGFWRCEHEVENTFTGVQCISFLTSWTRGRHVALKMFCHIHRFRLPLLIRVSALQVLLLTPEVRLLRCNSPTVLVRTIDNYSMSQI